MAWPAKFFYFSGSPEQLAQSADALVNGGLSSSDGSNIPRGFDGMDHYYSFWFKNVAGGLMVQRSEADGSSTELRVVAYAIPSGIGMVLGSKKASDIVSQFAALPGARAADFPGGPRSGDLTFV